MIDDHRWTGPDIPVANGSARPPAVGAGPIERSAMVKAELPCPACVHRTVCAIRPLIDVSELSFRTPPSPHEAIRVVLTAVITCAHYLEDPIPEETPKVPFTPAFTPTAAERHAASQRGGASTKAARSGARVESPQERLARIAAAEQRALDARRQPPAIRSGVPRADRLAARQAEIDAELDGKPVAKKAKTWTRAEDYADATNQALRDSGGALNQARKALGLGAESAIHGRITHLRKIGLLAPDVEQLVAERKAERDAAIVARGGAPS